MFLKNTPQILQPYLHKLLSDAATQDDVLCPVVTEKQYYTALEEFLCHVYGVNSETAESSDGAQPTSATFDISDPGVTEQLIELESYHVKHALCGGWLFDHEAHTRHYYFPSNVYPLGSTEEYAYFMRLWTKNVNKPYAERLYNRKGNFDQVLEHVPPSVCPCHYLLVFNVLGEDVWSATTPTESVVKGVNLSRIAVENELVLRTDFFYRKKANNYAQTNRWVYNTFVKPYHDRQRTAERSTPAAHLREGERFTTASGLAVDVTPDWYRHRDFEVRVLRTQRAQAQPSQPFVSVRQKHNRPDPPTAAAASTDGARNKCEDGRTDRLSGILSSLYFGSEHRDVQRDDRLLARCEDYESFLYSPSLSLSGCQHTDEESSFVQLRSGDEILTEIRKCRECKRTRVV